ncbi:MAG TPA: adenylosuccinate lyase [Bacillota bacterium]|nr:adenylosuccinate lyase [Bacillota bacterium]HOA15839.1 adenylosuccinate lyase [Bacillota bacterium]
MIDRYGYPEIKAIWEDDHRFQTWLKVEVLSAEAWSILGRVPKADVEALKAPVRIDPKRVAEIERVTNHDVIAFLTAVSEQLGEPAKHLHLGMTSSDMLDTAMAVNMAEALDIIIVSLDRLMDAVYEKALEHKRTIMMGRTHGVHAEPTTLGLKLLNWHSELERSKWRIMAARAEAAVGKISGPVGTYAGVPPFVEEYVCEKLGLKPAKVSSQIIQRDRYAAVTGALALLGSSLEKFATTVRTLQRTEISELMEPFGKGQKGSSAMPHKKNPITCERICGMARLLRGNHLAAMENIALWDERDISHSSVERVIIPDCTILADYVTRKFTWVVEGLVVRPDRMLRNLESTGGLVFSGTVLLKLVDSGMARDDAYAVVQRNAMKSWEDGTPFRKLCEEDPEISKRLTLKQLDECFDYGRHLAHVDEVFDRFGRKGRE